VGLAFATADEQRLVSLSEEKRRLRRSTKTKESSSQTTNQRARLALGWLCIATSISSTFWAMYGVRPAEVEPGRRPWPSSSCADSGSSVTTPLALFSATSPKRPCRAPCNANTRLATRAREPSSFCAVSTPKKMSALLVGANTGGHAGHIFGVKR